ncbi:hypothetical protein M426DRAFT_238303 [Hypoxylon sp. CI-4A]|nr:hypothetical protein M426DRAFT_238303 [Hypoxylon sp. CI-4A]
MDNTPTLHGPKELPSLCSSPGEFTPTASSIATDDIFENRPDTPVYKDNTLPWPGNTYIIREPASRHQVTLVHGELRLSPDVGNQGGYHWKCINRSGWLAFYSPVSGQYISYAFGCCLPQKLEQNGKERFTSRAHPEGGHLLLARCADELLQMRVGENSTLVLAKEGGTAWRFEKV